MLGFVSLFEIFSVKGSVQDPSNNLVPCLRHVSKLIGPVARIFRIELADSVYILAIRALLLASVVRRPPHLAPYH